ncbi:MAG: hypothetical protein ACXAEN_14255 [Candidatus Thorarchaeota archaeon]|jgi:hypothetical protein
MEKTKLEQCIAGLLAEFEKKTSVTISSVEIESLEGKNIFQDSRHKTTIRIEL